MASYPEVRLEEETLDKLIKERKSITRFGDGEFKLIVGERHKSFQDLNECLNSRMREVLASNHPDVLVAIHPIRKSESIGRIWQKFIIRIGKPVLGLLDPERVYESTAVFHGLSGQDEASFRERVDSIKRLGKGGKYYSSLVKIAVSSLSLNSSIMQLRSIMSTDPQKMLLRNTMRSFVKSMPMIRAIILSYWSWALPQQ